MYQNYFSIANQPNINCYISGSSKGDSNFSGHIILQSLNIKYTDTKSFNGIYDNKYKKIFDNGIFFTNIDSSLDILGILASQGGLGETICPMANLENYNIYPSYEGYFVKLFYYETDFETLDPPSEWYLYSVNNDNFKTILNRLNYDVKDFVTKLDKNYIYTFFIRNSKNTRFICSSSPKYQEIYFIYKTLKYTNTIINDFEYSKFPKLKKLDIKFGSSPNDIMDYVNELNPLKTTGILLQSKIKLDNFIYIINDKYFKFFKIKNYITDNKVRFIQLLRDIINSKLETDSTPNKKELSDSQRVLSDFISFNQEYKDEFNKIKLNLNNLSKKTYNQYVLIKIKRERIDISKKEYYIVCKCHEYYLNKKNMSEKCKMTKDLVYKIILNLDENFILSIIN